jgi:hypothetical protein
VRGALLAIGVLSLLLLALYHPLILHPSTKVWFDDYDNCQLEIPRLDFLARSVQAHHLPLWNPHSWAGQPMLASGQPGVLNPLYLAFTAIAPLHEGRLSFVELNWLFILIHLMGAWFCLWFCREIKLGWPAAILGALVFSATGFFGSVTHLDIACATALTPLVFLFAWRMWNGERISRGAAPLAIVLGVSWVTGHHEVPLIQCYAVLLGTIVAMVVRREWRIGAAAALAFALAFAIGAAQILPYWEYGHESRRWVGSPDDPVSWDTKVPYSVAATYSMPWTGLTGFVRSTRDPNVDSDYVGYGAALLALVGLWCCRRNRAAQMLAALAGCALLYALGSHTPFHRVLYEALPMLDKARAPMRGLFLAGFAVSGLAAVGADFAPGRILRAFAIPIALIAIVWGEAIKAPPVESPHVCAPALERSVTVPESHARLAIDFNRAMTDAGDLYGVDVVQSFVAAVPADILRLEMETPRTAQLLGVEGGMPRAWIVHQAISVPDVASLRRAIADPSTDFARTALMLGAAPTLDSCTEPEPVAVAWPDSDSVALRAHTACRGLLILSDTYLPEWQGTVDGKPQPILEVFGALRGVVLDPGEHSIEMHYRPISFRIGLWLSILGLLLAAVVMLRYPAPS